MTPNIDLGNVLSRTFETYRDQFTLLIPAALVIFLPIAIVNGLLQEGVEGILGSLLASVLALVGTAFLQGMVVEAVQDILDGRRDHTVGSLLQSAVPVLGPLFLGAILTGIAFGIGFLLLIVPGLFLVTIWAVWAPALVVERNGVFNSLGRSRELVRGSGWQVLGVIVILLVLQLVLAAIAAAILLAIIDSFVGAALAELISRVLIAPLSAIAAAVMYFQLRSLKEGQAMPGAAQPGAVAPGQSAAPPAAPGGGAQQPAAPGEQPPPGGGPESPRPGGGAPGNP